MTNDEQKLQELERHKKSLIHQYLELQDEVDKRNERIFHVCCEIETLNAQIARLQMKEASSSKPNGQKN